jgi:site-specific DNA recombinase
MARRKDPANDPNRTVALIYVRVSRVPKEDEVRKPSPKAQAAACRAMPGLKGLTIEDPPYQDLDFSGKNTKRPGFQDMMARVEVGDVKVVACYSLSRLSRSVRDLYDTIEHFEKYGVTFVSATENLDTSTPSGKVLVGILAVLAQFEREVTGQRIQMSFDYKRDQGQVAGQPPVGYHRVDGNLMIDPVWGPRVVDIFGLYASGGWSFQRLARHLNQEEIPAPKGRWHGLALQAMMRNPTYIGRMRREDGKAGEPAGHKALISRKVWDQCQAEREANMRVRGAYGGRGTDHALSGLACCQRCGSALHYRGAKKAGDGNVYTATYYRCKAQYQSGTCDFPYIPAPRLEDAVKESLAYLISPAEASPRARAQVMSGLQKAPSKRKAIQDRLKQLDERARRLSRQHEHHDIEDEEYDLRIKAVNLEKVAAREELAAAPQVDMEAGRERLDTLLGLWAASSPAQRNVLLKKSLGADRGQRGRGGRGGGGRAEGELDGLVQMGAWAEVRENRELCPEDGRRRAGGGGWRVDHASRDGVAPRPRAFGLDWK